MACAWNSARWCQFRRPWWRNRAAVSRRRQPAANMGFDACPRHSRHDSWLRRRVGRSLAAGFRRSPELFQSHGWGRHPHHGRRERHAVSPRAAREDGERARDRQRLGHPPAVLLHAGRAPKRCGRRRLLAAYHCRTRRHGTHQFRPGAQRFAIHQVRHLYRRRGLGLEAVRSPFHHGGDLRCQRLQLSASGSPSPTRKSKSAASAFWTMARASRSPNSGFPPGPMRNGRPTHRGAPPPPRASTATGKAISPSS